MEAESATQPLGDPQATEARGREGGYCIDWAIEPDYQGATGWLLYNEKREGYV